MVDADALLKPGAHLFLARLSFIAWTSVFILIVNFVFEWTYPYCNIQDSGPAKPAHGFPLPFIQDSEALSMSSHLMAHVLVLNIVLLALLAYPFMGWAVRRLSSARTLVGILIAAPGTLLLLLSMAMLWFIFDSGFVVSSIAGPYDSYWDYRPLGIISREYWGCTPSEFWFGTIKNPAALTKINP